MTSFKNIFTWYADYLHALYTLHNKEIHLTCFLLLTGIFTGYFDILDINSAIEEAFKNMVSKFQGHPEAIIFFKIFFQNCRATLIIMCTGILFSFFPIIATLLNGMMIGCVLQRLDTISHLSVSKGLLLTLPHGIFEIPAFILAISLGIRLGQWPFTENKGTFIKKTSTRSLQCYLLLIVPLLFLAGFIETSTIILLKN
jgi:uncharacterized membrane protein SpoIIM required for sporulation